MKHDESTFKIEECDVVGKLDGSLGIFFKYRDEWVFASRGSFTSRQAKAGGQMSDQLKLRDSCKADYTYLFEIIYPSNRIVVDYGDTCELVLLALVHTQSGLDLPFSDVRTEAARINVPVPKVDDHLGSFESLKSRNIANEEGYVIRSRTTGERVKLKFEEYLELHAIRTRFSRKIVRQWFTDAPIGSHHLGLPEARMKNVPDEHYTTAREEWNRLDEIRSAAQSEIEKSIRASINLSLAEVENTPMKGWICKYLRLSRQGLQGAETVAHEYSMSVVKKSPQLPEESREEEPGVEDIERGEEEEEEEGQDEDVEVFIKVKPRA
jgi:RNA ligase